LLSSQIAPPDITITVSREGVGMIVLESYTIIQEVAAGLIRTQKTGAVPGRSA